MLLFFTYYLPNSLFTMYKNLILLGVLLALISCETTSPLTKKPEIIKEISEKTIYQPEENLPTENLEDKNIDVGGEIVSEIQDFTGIENYQQKSITSMISDFGDFDFSKKEKLFELHRYNVGNCRIFIQNNTLDKKIIAITIFHIKEKKTLSSYEQESCFS